MSNILITDIPVFTDIAIEQQENIVGGVTIPGITNPVPSYILLNPIVSNFLGGLDFNLVDVENYLNNAGLDIKLPTDLRL
ncbi:hypothetical protein MEN41_08600 [Dolichospermum sp. ST_con]|nr:hypothetical protein [Dolichospermum sp. ST_con]MDD1420003.1 hypothetical protein [Dolichospermum sp. ST_sed1]MDD1426558.1 hypothetical protein [Dolichospermum sp. ST_sed9]MDD1433116.1 hypothetical protein [Dolichospermum sp. ST_sed6]MDD1437935.1 hypothetical protein [Dolichospermum sp. ST_sed10]MDD1442482.1 hypothetical protein [Dolichospermum sp. ST_sed3]MDD1448136.1 hypothetical protein [Dolichospermum sp. ST_sed8]MDD1455637.1 hypothetical protein [Dolichospermum sp. ST_sed7]MDD146229